MKDLSMTYKFFNIILACLQNMTLGGILYGWTSISGTLLLSDETEGGPALSPQYVHMMFVVATFFSFIGPLMLGIVLDNYGPRVCSIVSVGLISLGCFLFAKSTKSDFPLFIPAISLIAFGGPGVQSAIIHLSNLFPAWKASATACITGSFQMSFIVFLIFDQLWMQKGYSYEQLFMGYSFICLANLVISFLLWPDKPYNYEEQVELAEEQGQHIPHHHHHHHHKLSQVEEEGEDDEEDDDEDAHQMPIGPIRLPSVFIQHKTFLKRTESANIRMAVAATTGHKALKDMSLQEQIQSPEFMNLTVFFLVNSFWMNFYIGTFDIQLRDGSLLEKGEDIEFARLFTVIITCGVVGIPVIGTLMDTLGFPTASALTITAGFVWAVLLYIQARFLLVVSFIFYAIYRTFFFTFFFAYLADTLGFKYFGVLAGIVFVLGGVLSLLQYPLAEFSTGTCHERIGASKCDHGAWQALNAFMALTIFATLYFSYKDWEYRKKRSSAFQTAMKAASKTYEARKGRKSAEMTALMAPKGAASASATAVVPAGGSGKTNSKTIRPGQLSTSGKQNYGAV